jgi:translation initiation factor IF-3
VIRKRPVKRQPKVFIPANHQIRFPEVRVLDEHGEMLGIMPTRDAHAQAMAAEKDLVLVTDKSKPPIVKIIELAKFKYQLQQKEAESRKKARAQKTKEIVFTPFIGEADFQTRMRRVHEFLEKGDKVRLTVEFKGRQNSKKEFGFETLRRVFAETAEEATVEIQPQAMGRKITAQIMPVKKTTVKPKPTAPVTNATTVEAPAGTAS